MARAQVDLENTKLEVEGTVFVQEAEELARQLDKKWRLISEWHVVGHLQCVGWGPKYNDAATLQRDL